MHAQNWQNSESIPLMTAKAYFCINKAKLLTQHCSSSRKITPFCTCYCTTPAISVCNLCIHPSLWKDDTLWSIQNSAAMLVPFPALTKPISLEQSRYCIVKQVFFLHSMCMKALLAETVFSFWSGNHRGFQPHAGEKKKQIMGIFSEPCCFTQETGKNRNFHNSKDSFHLLLTIYFILLHQILRKRNKKDDCTLCMEKKDQHVLLVEAQKEIL